MPWKYPRANVRKDYAVTLEVSFIIALGILVFLFRAELAIDATMENVVTEQEVVQMEEIVQTEQVQKPPPPPRPQAPVVVSDDVILEDLDLDLDATLDIDEPLADLPPPPPPDEAVVEEEEVDDLQVFVAVEQMPELIGGIGDLQAKLRYPEVARLAGVSGRVFVEFVVDQEGNVTNPVVIRGIGGGCDEEAMRVVKDAKFIPGKQRGRPVRVRYVLPIMFVLR
jgi:protein TonB